MNEDLKLKHFGCYAHTINLIAHDAQTHAQFLIDKFKIIVAHFKRSSSALAKFNKQQKLCKPSEQPKRLTMDL